jgi:ketosteroid isomerase-like protein
MIKILAVTLLLLACVTFAEAQQPQASSTSQQPSVELPPGLARVLSDYEAAWQKRDAAALAALFLEDGFVLPPGRPPVRGRSEIERHYTGQGGPLSLRAIVYGADGNVGYIIGGYAAKKGDPDDGKFTLTLRKGAKGRWLIMSDMDNASHPPRMQAQPEGRMPD